MDILSFLPQQPPFVMVDRLLFSDEDMSRCGLEVRADNLLVDEGVLTEAGLVEHMAQTVAAGAGKHASERGFAPQQGFIASVNNLSIARLPRIGESLITEARVTQRIGSALVVEARCECAGQEIAMCELRIFIAA